MCLKFFAFFSCLANSERLSLVIDLTIFLYGSNISINCIYQAIYIFTVFKFSYHYHSCFSFHHNNRSFIIYTIYNSTLPDKTYFLSILRLILFFCKIILLLFVLARQASPFCLDTKDSKVKTAQSPATRYAIKS